MSDTDQPPKKKHGCFFYGCITSLVLLLVAGLTLFFAVRYGLHWANSIITQYTETSPMTLEKADDLPAADLKALNARVDAFTAAMNAHGNTPPLVLTGAEINAVIASNPDMKALKDCIYITLDGDTIKAQLSVPLDILADNPKLKLFNLKGRYLNGSGTFKASVTGGKLSLVVQSLDARGKPLPENIMVNIRQNLGNFLNPSANPSPFQQFESIQVKDGTLIITPKGN